MFREMKYFSMFTGIGTGEKGIEQAYGNQSNSDQYESAFAGAAVSGQRRDRLTVSRRTDVLPTNHTALRHARCIGFTAIDHHGDATPQTLSPNNGTNRAAQRCI